MKDQSLRSIRQQLVELSNGPKPTIEVARSKFNAFCNQFISNNDLELEDITLQHCLATWINRDRIIDETKKVILFFHGGAFSKGSTRGHLNFLNQLLKACSIPILGVDYRHIPEYPFPSGLEDCIESHAFLLREGYSSKNVAWVGFTSGGSLALSALSELLNKNIPLPKACVCISPATDISFQHASTENFKKDWISKEKLEQVTRLYGADEDLKSPKISPVYADLQKLPPLLLQVGSDEVLRGDIEHYASMAKKAGANVQLSVWKDMIHCWPLFSSALPSEDGSITEVAEFIAKHLNTSNSEQ